MSSTSTVASSPATSNRSGSQPFRKSNATLAPIYGLIAGIMIFVFFCNGTWFFVRIRRRRREWVSEEVASMRSRPRLWEPAIKSGMGEGRWGDIKPVSLALQVPPLPAPPTKHPLLPKKTQKPVQVSVPVQIVVIVAMPQKKGLRMIANPEYHFGVTQKVVAMGLKDGIS